MLVFVLSSLEAGVSSPPPPLGAALPWPMAGLCDLGCGVDFNECVSVCVCMCVLGVCVYMYNTPTSTGWCKL